MGRKSKYSYETKLAVIQAYEHGESGFDSIASRFNIGITTCKTWWMIYQSQGVHALKETHTNKSWSKELKIAAVNEYLSGYGSLESVFAFLQITSPAAFL